MKFLIRISKLVAVLCFAIIIIFIVERIKKKCKFEDLCNALSDTGKDFKAIALVILSFSLMISLMTNGIIQQSIGIHNLKIEPQGTYCYLVELDGSTYPAEIEIVGESIEIYDNNTGTEHSKTLYYYYLRSAEVENEKLLHFVGEEKLKIGKNIEVHDEYGRSWDCVLLNHHAYSPVINEDSKINGGEIFMLIVTTAPIVFCIAALTKRGNSKSKENENDDLHIKGMD